MREVGQTGRTVLFVSHDMQSIARLCSRAIWIKDGALAKDGTATDVISEYLHEQSQKGAEKVWETAAAAPGNDIVRLRRVRVCDEARRTVSAIDIRRPVAVELTYDVLRAGKVLVPNVHFYNEQGVCIFVSHDWQSRWRTESRQAGTYTSTMRVPGNFLAEGTIFVTAAISTYLPFEVHLQERDTVAFSVIDSLDGDSMRGDYAGLLPGVVRPNFDWETEFSRRD
jgi:lipopolysaccharide transport system ATP-binding protein